MYANLMGTFNNKYYVRYCPMWTGPVYPQIFANWKTQGASK